MCYWKSTMRTTHWKPGTARIKNYPEWMNPARSQMLSVPCFPPAPPHSEWYTLVIMTKTWVKMTFASFFNCCFSPHYLIVMKWQNCLYILTVHFLYWQAGKQFWPLVGFIRVTEALSFLALLCIACFCFVLLSLSHAQTYTHIRVHLLLYLLSCDSFFLEPFSKQVLKGPNKMLFWNYYCCCVPVS